MFLRRHQAVATMAMLTPLFWAHLFDAVHDGIVRIGSLVSHQRWKSFVRLLTLAASVTTLRGRASTPRAIGDHGIQPTPASPQYGSIFRSSSR